MLQFILSNGSSSNCSYVKLWQTCNMQDQLEAPAPVKELCPPPSNVSLKTHGDTSEETIVQDAPFPSPQRAPSSPPLTVDNIIDLLAKDTEVL